MDSGYWCKGSPNSQGRSPVVKRALISQKRSPEWSLSNGLVCVPGGCMKDGSTNPASSWSNVTLFPWRRRRWSKQMATGQFSHFLIKTFSFLPVHKHSYEPVYFCRLKFLFLFDLILSLLLEAQKHLKKVCISFLHFGSSFILLTHKVTIYPRCANSHKKEHRENRSSASRAVGKPAK